MVFLLASAVTALLLVGHGAAAATSKSTLARVEAQPNLKLGGRQLIMDLEENKDTPIPRGLNDETPGHASTTGTTSAAADGLAAARLAAQAHGNLFANDTWHRFIDAPVSPLVEPRYILHEYTKGSVERAGSLVADEGGPAVLSRRQASDEEPVIVLDFGRNVVGLVVIEFDGSSRTPGNQDEGEDGLHRPGLRLSFSETLKFLGETSDFSRSYNAYAGFSDQKFTNGSDQIAVAAEPYTWTNQLGCAYPEDRKVCSDGLHGFRYLRISLASLEQDAPYTQEFGSVSLKSVKLRWSAYLGGDPDTFLGWFECSDESLTRHWYEGVYTNDICADVFRKNDTEPRDAFSETLEGKLVLHDGAKRDRDPYVGDLVVAGPTAYLTREYAKDGVANVLEDLAAHQREDGWIPPASIIKYTLHLFDYPLWWVFCVYTHVLYTGDAAFGAAMYEAVRKVLDVYYPSNMNETLGLLQKSMGMHQTDGYGDYAFLPREGVVSYYNALYVLALQAAARLSKHPGIDAAGDDARWNQRADELSQAMRAHCWDGAAGAFWDGQCYGGDDSKYFCPAHAQDGNSLAILSSVAPAESEEAASILRYYASKATRWWGNSFYDSPYYNGEYSDRVYAFISHFEISARFLVRGFAPSALNQLRRTYDAMVPPSSSSVPPKIANTIVDSEVGEEQKVVSESHQRAAQKTASSSLGPGTFWEGIGKDGEDYQGGFTSMAHGWSTGIVSSLTGKVLGVEPQEDRGWGFQEWRVRPLSWDGMVAASDEDAGPCEGCDSFDHVPITWARGVVPTPQGKITVAWDLSPYPDPSTDKLYVLSVSAPKGTSGEIWVPTSPTQPGGREGGAVRSQRQAEVSISTFTFRDGEPSEEIVEIEPREEQGDEESGYRKIKLEGWDGDDLVHVVQVKVSHHGSAEGL